MRALTIVLLLGLAACAAPRATGRAPVLEPPPARGGQLTRDDALARIQQAPDPEAAIERLDHERFAFALDAATIDWFSRAGAPDEVVDYLKKRSRVDWDGLRGDVDPLTPGGDEYVDPRRGYGEDFAGADRRGAHESPRSQSPYTTKPTSWERAAAGGQ